MEKVKKKVTFWSVLLNIIISIFIAICLIVIFFNLTHNYHYVDGASMQPTLNYYSQDAVFSSKIKSYKRGDIIIVEKEESDVNGNKLYVVKRLIAIEGDKVCVRLVDGEYRIVLIKQGQTEEQILEEKYLLNYEDNENLYKNFYLMAKNHYGIEKDEFFTVPEDEIFYLGDNRKVSNDCSIYGTKNKNLVVGKVDYIIYGKTKPVRQIIKQFFGW